MRKNANAQRGAPPAAKRPFRIQFSHVLLFLSGMVLMALLYYLFFPGTGAWKSKVRQSAGKQQDKTRAGPWGKLEYLPLALDRPDEHFTNMVEQPVKTRWVLRKASEGQLVDFLNSLQLTEPAKSFLFDHTHWHQVAGGFEMTPPAEIVISLDPEARHKLYAELARDPENIPQCMPFTFRTDGFDEWFAECGLTKEKVALVRKLSYTNDENLCFADASVFREVSTPGETMCLLKGLWRVSTFMLQVRITPETDVNALINYWGKGGPARAYKPLLEAMTRVAEGASINVSYFFPPFARLRLYTYPQPTETNALQQDCFWSAMNFFNEQPDNRLFDPVYKDLQLSTEYSRVPEADRQFGDLFMLLATNKVALHMCVYVADDVVFTKNGANAVQPWVLMKIPEMLGIYQRFIPYRLVYYRRKHPPTFSAAYFQESAYELELATPHAAPAPPD